MSTYSGRCLCGLVRFTAAGVETDHHACHCGMCRRWAGGPMMAALVHELNFEGEGPGRYRSSEWAERGFCRNCGSHLFYRFLPADLYLVSVGSFDDAAPFTLAEEIYVDHQPAGYAFAGDRPRLTEAEAIRKFSGG
jgi:hypothetical protein